MWVIEINEDMKVVVVCVFVVLVCEDVFDEVVNVYKVDCL